MCKFDEIDGICIDGVEDIDIADEIIVDEALALLSTLIRANDTELLFSVCE